MRLLRLSNAQPVSLITKQALGMGGEATVYPLQSDTHHVAKIYHELPAEQVQKLKVMVANPPEDPALTTGHLSIAFPLDLLVTPAPPHKVVGFLMARAIGTAPLFHFYNPSTRRQEYPLVNYLYLHRMGRNLAGAVRVLHGRGYVVGDVNESNILATETALITLVDTDSFQVRDPETGAIFRCPVGRREFTPPELQGQVFQEADRLPEHDLFGLGVLLFQLLMEGTHPFAGVFTGSGEPPTYETRIQQGHFPFGSKPCPYRPMPAAPSFEILHPSLRRLFLLCFEAGYSDPSARPSAVEWQSAFSEAENSLLTCAKNPQHRYGNHLATCPWCERTQRLAGRDPFPSVQAVRQGKHTTRLKRQATPVPESSAPPTPTYGVYTSPLPATPTLPTSLTSFTRNPWAVATLLVSMLSLLPLYRVLLGVTALFLGMVAWRKAHHLQGNGRGTATLGMFIGLVMCLLAYAMRLPQGTLFEMGKGISALAFAPNGKTLAVATRKSEDVSERGGTVHFWDVESEEQRSGLGETFLGDVSGITFSPDGSRIAVSSWGSLEPGHVSLFRADGSSLWRKDAHRNAVQAVAFSVGGEWIASGGSREYARTREVFSEVKLWSAERGEEVALWAGAGSIYALAFSPDGAFLAAGCGSASGGSAFRSGERGRIELYDLKTRKLLWKKGAHGTAVQALAFSPNGKTLASAGNGSNLHFWEPRAGTLLKTFSGETDGVTALTFLKDGKTLVGQGQGNTLVFWNTETGGVVRRLTGHNAPIRTLALSPDGNTLASGSLDGIIRLWRLER